MDSLVSTQWLADQAGAADLVILDATLLDPALGRDAEAEFADAHIPGARFLGLKTLVDASSPLPNTLPEPGAFASRLAALGVNGDARLVLYDNSPWKTAARGWWMLRASGFERVAILDGGLALWKAEGRPIETGAPLPAAAVAAATAPAPFAGTRDLAAVQANLQSDAEQLVDARSAARYAGEEAERAGVEPGHIPGSRSLPYSKLFDGDGRWKRGAALQAEFDRAGVDPGRPLVVTCGSGITACVVAFGAHLLGRDDVALYDGSWTEWGGDPATPKATGPAA
ncbi:sulfurtransferase [Sphingomonas quercus]|uniref:Sulfurtransferase n=1 Tax=Sphingomonas quercus TaxID=2842451 RepID=A0ABS6BHK3_9SPHN|nr:sulfurtransferase [Sphingomonas quercus]MBU3077292.1 sulfurtransferase [Sphingomonas quercus]